MKKKLLVLTSFIALSATLAACGESTISYKGSNSRSHGSTNGEYVSPYQQYGYDTTPYTPRFNDYDTTGANTFRINLLNYGYIINGQTFYPSEVSGDIYDVTPQSISQGYDYVHIMRVDRNGFFLYSVGSDKIYRFASSSEAQIIQMGLYDYDNNGVKDIVTWGENKSASQYVLNIFDMSKSTLFNVTKLSFSHPDDLSLFFYDSGIYINQKKVYYVDGEFYCTSIFNYTRPTYYTT